MGNYYLDIETTGLDEVQNKITTIQYVELERSTGKQIGEITILKEWELGEKEMLKKFSSFHSPRSFRFRFEPYAKYMMCAEKSAMMGIAHKTSPLTH